MYLVNPHNMKSMSALCTLAKVKVCSIAPFSSPWVLSHDSSDCNLQCGLYQDIHKVVPHTLKILLEACVRAGAHGSRRW